jgi:hypothetical protein
MLAAPRASFGSNEEFRMSENKKWEYRTITLGSAFSSPKDDEIGAMLNEWGDEGWEVIVAHHLEGSNKIRIIAKRETAQSIRKRSTWP